jgi:two-component sensor histidine kinase
MQRLTFYYSFLFLLLNLFTLSANSQVSNKDNINLEKITDSIIKSISQSDDKDSLKIKKLNRFAARKRYEKATLKSILEAKKIAKGNDIYLADTYCSLGNYYFYNSELDSAETILNKAKKLIIHKKAPFINAAIRNSLSGIYRKRGNIQLAIATLLESKSILEQIDTLKLTTNLRKRLKGENVVLNNSLANFYNQMEDFDKALAHYDKAYSSALDLNSIANAGVILSNKGNLLLNIGKFKEALVVLKKAKQLKIEGKAPKSSIANSNQSIGEVFVKLENYDDAMNSFNKAYDYYSKANSKLGLMEISTKRGMLNNVLKKYPKAITDCSRAKKLALENNILEIQKDACLCLSKAYEKVNKLGKSLANLKIYQKAKDSIFNKKNIKKITQLEMEYNFKKEKELQNLKLAAKEKENKTMVRSLVLGVLTLLLISGLLYRMNYIRRKSNFQLKEKNQKISETLAINEILIKETHHRVKNNLQIVSSLLNMQSKYLDDQKSKEIISDSQNRIKSMSLIHQQLYQEENITSIETTSYFTKLIDSLCLSYGIDISVIEASINIESLLLDVDTAIPLGLVLNELISNAFKHGVDKKSGEFYFKFRKRSNKELVLIVRDNGQGISNGFDWKNTKSYGMKLIHSLSKKLKADLSFNNKNGLEVIMKIHKFKLAKTNS